MKPIIISSILSQRHIMNVGIHGKKSPIKLFDDRLQKFICKNNILSDCQFGFRTGRSSSMAIVNLAEKITNSLDNTKSVISVFIEPKKAFDTIDHTILLQKLNHYRICGIVNQ